MDENWNLAKQMRTEEQQQFYTLVRMHLSFVLDLNSEDSDINADKKGRQLKWNLPFAKKSKGLTKAMHCEGSYLTQALINQVNILIKYLNKPDIITQEGIFRKTGNLKRQQDLKFRLASDSNTDIGEERYSVHDCASLLKSYLSELPEPLLTESLYTAYCQVSQLNKERLVLALQMLVLLLPEENYCLLRDVLKLLHKVAKNSDSNKMSATNLSTVFTPHLLWPRKISAETLHANSQSLTMIVAFMIEETDKLFLVPDTLATDIRAYLDKKERLQRSPMRQLNESVCDGTTANTVFTFVDRERTAQENGSNPTELALAELYAHIQSMPESAQKKKLVKNFNKTNGQGTPAVRNDGRGKHRRSRSVRDSIKKHLSSFGKNGANSPVSNDSSSPDVFIKTPLLPSSLIKVKSETARTKTTPCRVTRLPAKENRDPGKRNTSADTDEKLASGKQGQKRTSPNAGSASEVPPKRSSPNCDTLASKSETPSLVLPTRRPTRSMHSNTNVRLSKILQPVSPPEFPRPSLLSPSPAVSNTMRNNERAASNKKLGSCQAIRTSPRFYPPTPVGIHDHGLPCPSNYLTPQRRRIVTTSTPAPRPGGFVTPHVERNTSMSPITRSAQRMPRAMQETMMTPRSRKPVVSLSGSDLSQLTSMDRWTPEKRFILEESESSGKDSLSSTFRDYLISRSVLTASPVDLSFSSRTDDFQSLSSKASSLEELGCPSKEEMSKSLLFCMDGNDPSTPSRQPASSSVRPLHVCETAI